MNLPKKVTTQNGLILLTFLIGFDLTMLLNLINHQQPNFYKIYFYVKGTFEPKYQLPINEI